jgi:hypothetical protein
MTVEGQVASLYDGDHLTATLNATFAHYLAHKLPLHPFLYPPHYLLLLVPFGMLPPVVAGILFLALSFGGLLWAALSCADGWQDKLFLAGALALCPATAIVVCLGQNSFLTCGLIVGGFALLQRRPILAGILFGMISYKPQLALMVPVALIASRQWRTLAAAAGTAALLCALSVAAFGLEPWRAWIELMIAPSAMFERWNQIARLNGQSVHAYAVFLGASAGVAHAMQLAAALAAAILVYFSNRAPMKTEIRVALVLIATMLSAPHVLDYDALLLGIAACLFLIVCLRDNPRPIESAVAVLIWLSPLINPPTAFPVGAVTPFLTLVLLGLVVKRGLSGTTSPSPAALGQIRTARLSP